MGSSARPKLGQVSPHVPVREENPGGAAQRQRAGTRPARGELHPAGGGEGADLQEELLPGLVLPEVVAQQLRSRQRGLLLPLLTVQNQRRVSTVRRAAFTPKATLYGGAPLLV